MGFYNESGGGGGAAVWGAITGTLSDQTDLQTAINTVQGKIGNWIILEDQKAAGTQGGTFTAGDWRTRDLNTKVSDPNGNCVLTSNQFTLTAGNYGLVIASAPGYRVEYHRIRLYDVTNAATKIAGNTGLSLAAADQQTSSTLMGYIGTLAANTTFQLEHNCGLTKDTTGFGTTSNFSLYEVFAHIAIEDLN